MTARNNFWPLRRRHRCLDYHHYHHHLLGRRYIPVVLAIVFVAAIILQLPPALAVATGGDQDHVASVVQMEERVSRLGANSVHVAAKSGKIRNGYWRKVEGILKS